MKKLLTILSAGLVWAGSASALTIQAQNASIKQHEAGHLLSNGETAQYVIVPAAGEYRVQVQAMGLPAGGVWPTMALSIDGLPYERTEVNTPSFAWTNYTFNVRLSATVHAVGVQYMNDAIVNGEDRNLGLLSISIDPVVGSAQPALSNAAAWVAAGPSRDAAAVAEANATIPVHRMDPATVRVVDMQGNVVPNAAVSVQQLTSDFLFGASVAGWKSFGTTAQNDTYAQRIKEVFNYGTVPFFWPLIEPVNGVYDFARTDDQVNFLVSNGMQAKAHALIWHEDYAIPAWANGVFPSAAKQQALVTTVMNRYKNTVKFWEVVNEPLNVGGDYITPNNWARGIKQDANLVMNEYGHFYQGLVELYDYVDAVRAAGGQVDTLGIQAHAPTDMAFPLEYVKWNLDQFASLGAALHITEFTPPSSGIPVTGAFWRGNWSEAVQAQYAAEFYRVCFANPAVKGVSWWDVSDHGAWVPGGGLLRSDLSQKPAYTALKHLITNEWRTNLSQNTTSNGQIGFNGFHGRYRVSVTVNGQTQTAEFNLTEGGANAVTVTMTNLAPVQTPAPVATVNALRTKDTTPTLNGTVANATAVRVSLNGSTWYNATVSGSTWSVTLPTAQANGYFNVRAEAANAQGVKVLDTTTNELIIDTVAPVITITGGTSLTIARYSTYNDAGATANDAIEGNVTAKITKTGTVNTGVAGTYYITYTCKDLLNNTRTAKRTVKVL